MKHHKYNQLIAEYCGWSHIKPSGLLDGQLIGYPPIPTLGKFEEVPDYWNDLNAMNAAEHDLLLEYFEGPEGVELCKKYDLNLDKFTNRVWPNFVWNLPSEQRAEAFLKTIGKWEE